jgi:hypothetical protein
VLGLPYIDDLVLVIQELVNPWFLRKMFYNGLEMGKVFIEGFGHIPVCRLETKLARIPDDGYWMVAVGLAILYLASQNL